MRKTLALCALVLLALPGLAQGDVIVTTDSGNIGSFNMTNTGVVGSTATIVFGVPTAASQLNTVNGVVVTPELVAINTPVTLLVTPTGPGTYSLGLSPPTYTKTVGNTPGAQAVLGFSLTTGSVPVAQPDFFNVSGPVTSLLANNDPNFNFINFASGHGLFNMTFTATSFTGAPNFAGLFSTVGATAVGNGSFSQVVPEPAPMALLGVAACAFLAYRRLTA